MADSRVEALGSRVGMNERGAKRERMGWRYLPHVGAAALFLGTAAMGILLTQNRAPHPEPSEVKPPCTATEICVFPGPFDKPLIGRTKSLPVFVTQD